NQNYTPATSGSYKVQIVDNLSCFASSNVLSITINASTTPVISGNGVVCGGSSLTLSADNTYSGYLWSTGATTQSINVTTAGTYTLTVTNASGCTGSTSKTVTSGSATVPTLSASGATEFCNGGSVTLSTVPSNYSSYLWSNGITTATNTISSSGNYTCTVTDVSGCTATSAATSVNVHTVAVPVATTSTGATSYCDNAGVYLTTSSMGYSYQWFKGSTPVNGATNQNYTPSLGGSYKVQITDNLSCSSTSNALSITINTGTIPAITGGGS